MIDVYTDYSVVTETALRQPESLQLPSFSMSFYANTERKVIFKSSDVNVNNTFGNTVEHIAIRNPSTMNWMKCPANDFPLLSNVVNFNTTIIYVFKYFKFQFKNEKYKNLFIVSDPGDIIKFKFNFPNISLAYLYHFNTFHENQIEPIDGDNQIFTTHDGHWRQSICITRQELLPYPYKSDCKIYKERSSYGCEKNCMENAFYEKRGADSIFTEVEVNFTRPRIKSRLNSEHDIVVKCKARCYKPECSSVQYNMKAESYHYQEEECEDYKLVLAFEPIETISVFKPMMTLTDLIVFLGSVIGIWFGYSYLDINQLINYIINSLVPPQDNTAITLEYLHEGLRLRGRRLPGGGIRVVPSHAETSK